MVIYYWPSSTVRFKVARIDESKTPLPLPEIVDATEATFSCSWCSCPVAEGQIGEHTLNHWQEQQRGRGTLAPGTKIRIDVP